MTHLGDDLGVERWLERRGCDDVGEEQADLRPSVEVGFPLRLPLRVGTLEENTALGNPVGWELGFDLEVEVRPRLAVPRGAGKVRDEGAECLLGLAVREVEPLCVAVKQGTLKLVLHTIGRATLGTGQVGLDLIEEVEEELDESDAGRHVPSRGRASRLSVFRRRSGVT